MEARLLLGSDDAQSDSGHGSDEGWEGQAIATRQAAAVKAGSGGTGHGYCRGKWLRASLGVRAPLRQRKMAQSFIGGGEGKCEVVIWLTPSPAYIEPPWAAERLFLRLFATPNQFGPFGFPVVPKNVKLHNKNYYDEFNYTY